MTDGAHCGNFICGRVITKRRSVAKNIGCYRRRLFVALCVGVFVGLCVNMITSERVNVE